MGSFSDTPAAIAGGTIKTYRFVTIDVTGPTTNTDDNTVVQAAASNVTVVGITDGSTRRFDTTNGDHALDGEPVTLQGGDVVLVECAGAINRGALVESDADGKAVTATTTTGGRFHAYVALEAGASGRIIRVMKVSGWRYYP